MTRVKNLMLADDDCDDCMLFMEALEDLRTGASLRMVSNGVDLMEALVNDIPVLPDLLFLDLNMPKKTGIECLSEIKLNNHLKSLPVIIFSTSYDSVMVNELYNCGAQYYVRKPGEFSKLKLVIHRVIIEISNNNIVQPSKELFVLNDE